ICVTNFTQWLDNEPPNQFRLTSTMPLSSPARQLLAATEQLCDELAPLRFAEPVSYVYNPLVYAKAAHDLYLTRFGDSHKRVLMLGMNPGPWGMSQTGVPFGEIPAVRDWMG